MESSVPEIAKDNSHTADADTMPEKDVESQMETASCENSVEERSYEKGIEGENDEEEDFEEGEQSSSSPSPEEDEAAGHSPLKAPPSKEEEEDSHRLLFLSAGLPPSGLPAPFENTLKKPSNNGLKLGKISADGMLSKNLLPRKQHQHRVWRLVGEHLTKEECDRLTVDHRSSNNSEKFTVQCLILFIL